MGSEKEEKKLKKKQKGPKSKHNVMIATAFYGTQVDICGPFKT